MPKIKMTDGVGLYDGEAGAGTPVVSGDWLVHRPPPA
jgi:hypothetical protein